MIVEEVMVKKPITVKKNDSLAKAQELMVDHSIRHLPVVSNHDLVGIITESDIRAAFFGQAQKVSGGKKGGFAPAEMKVKDHMTREPMTVFPETNIEDAALLIYKNKIGGLPVVRDGRLVGIISIMDMLGLFVDMMGILHASSRIDVVMGKDPKSFEKVSQIFNDQNLKIISVGMSPHPKDDNKRVYCFRLDLCETGPVVEKIKKEGFKVLTAID